MFNTLPYYEGTSTSGYNTEVQCTVQVLQDRVIIRIVPNYIGTFVGSIRLPQIHNNTTYTKVTPPYHKNWRWYDGFRIEKPYIYRGNYRYIEPICRAISNKVSMVQVAAQKRKAYIQKLRVTYGNA